MLYSVLNSKQKQLHGHKSNKMHESTLSMIGNFEEKNRSVLYLFSCRTNSSQFEYQEMILILNTEGPCLMQLLVLGKIRISQMFGLCNLPNANFGLFISLVRLFFVFLPKKLQ